MTNTRSTSVRSIGPQIIGLCGHMGVGKDAAAALLSMVGYRRLAFADQVRIEVEDAIRRRIVPFRPLEVAYISEDLRRAHLAEVWSKPTDVRMRRILQWWGTEYRRTQDQDYWVKLAAAKIDGPTVFSDVRFPNEVEVIRSRGGVIWKIDRPVKIDGIEGHASERAIRDIVPDLVIENTGTLLDLAEKLTDALCDERREAA